MAAPHTPNPEHTGLDVLAERLAQAKQQVQVGGRYQHYRGGTYRVLELGFDEATEELVVVYAMEYGPGLVAVRRLESWLETVKINGRAAPRFNRITT